MDKQLEWTLDPAWGEEMKLARSTDEDNSGSGKVPGPYERAHAREKPCAIAVVRSPEGRSPVRKHTRTLARSPFASEAGCTVRGRTTLRELEQASPRRSEA